MEDPWADSASSSAPLGSTSQAGDDTTTTTATATAPAGGSAPSPTAAAAPTATTTITTTTTTPSTRPSRLTPRRLVAQATRLEAVEDDPLGPLGAASDTSPDANDDDTAAAGKPGGGPPVPPLKEQLPLRTTMPVPPGGRHRGGPPDPHRIDDDDDDDDDDGDGDAARANEGGGARGSGRARQPPPVQAALPSPVRSSNLPSVSVEQAARPTFHITVGDPHKVGDLATSHIVYSVRTKVCNRLRRRRLWLLLFLEEADR